MSSRERKLEENVGILGPSPTLYLETTATNFHKGGSIKKTILSITSSEARSLKSGHWWGPAPFKGSREGSSQASW